MQSSSRYAVPLCLPPICLDLSIELGKLLYWPPATRPRTWSPVGKMVALGLLTLLFLVGGGFDAVGFKRVGYLATLALAGILALLSAVPVFDGIRSL